MKKYLLAMALIGLVGGQTFLAAAATVTKGVNSAIVLYLLNNCPTKPVNYTIDGCLYTTSGQTEVFAVQGTITPGNCIEILSNNSQHDVAFGPEQMTRALQGANLSPQLALDTVLPANSTALLAGKTPIALMYFPLDNEIVGSITGYYLNSNHTMAAIDSPAFFEGICSRNGGVAVNTGKLFILSR